MQSVEDISPPTSVLLAENEKKEIEIGEEHQAELPELIKDWRKERVNDEPQRGFAEQIWSAARSREKLGTNFDDDDFYEDYIAKAKHEIMQARPKGAMAIHVDTSEYLAQLHCSNYDTNKALAGISLSTDRFVDWWSKDENKHFQFLFGKHKDNLCAISRAILNKTSQQIVARFQRAQADQRRSQQISSSYSFKKKSKRSIRDETEANKRAKLSFSTHSAAIEQDGVDEEEVDNFILQGPEADDPREVERIARLFLKDARGALAPDTFAALLHLLRMYDQRIINESVLLSNCFELLQDQTAVREAFLYFAHDTDQDAVNAQHHAIYSSGPPAVEIERPISSTR